jgi:hypothetical protein
MAERHRSKDGRSETKDLFGEPSDIDQQGRTGGRLAREIGTEDEEKRSKERPASATRVTKSSEEKGADNDA